MSLSPPVIRHRVSRKIIWIAIAFAICLLIALLIAASWAASRIDGRAVLDERQAIAAALQQAKDRLPFEQDSSAAWDDAVINTRARDQDWIAENLIEWVSAYYDYDRVYLVAPDDSIVRAAAYGAYAGTHFAPLDALVLAPLIARLRDQMAEASIGYLDSTPVISGLGMSDTALLANGEVGFVSIRPIVPTTSALTQSPGTEYLLVSIKRIDQDLLDDIAGRFGIQDLRLVHHSTAIAALPVLDRDGRTAAFLVWTPDYPAKILLWETTPAIVGLLTLGAACMIVLLGWLRRTLLKLESSQAETSYLAQHDPLTGVANRVLFEMRVREALNYQFLARTKVLLVSLDLDHFKEINDTRGHAAGDELLRGVVKRLLIELSDEATLARLGGDEFAIVQPGIISPGQAQWICQRLLRCLGEPFQLAGGTITVTASLGISLEDGLEVPPEEMLRRADVALYAAKLDGRNKSVLYDPEMDRKRRDKRTLEADLRNALLNDAGLYLVYQPIFAARTGEIAGAEALVRWQHPSRGPLTPDIFIGLAEETGVIDQLGLWVLREACRFAVKTNLPWVAVNISPVQFRNRGLAQQILTVLREEQLPPSCLEVEITEGVLLQDSSFVQTTLTSLRNAGVRVALDDFGTGYSSISYLRTYTVDKLKIDQSFTRSVETDGAVASIVRSIIEMAEALGMSVTAEGVEEETQRRMLTGMGCKQLQGYLLSRPLPPEQMLSILQKQRSTSLIRLFAEDRRTSV